MTTLEIIAPTNQTFTATLYERGSDVSVETLSLTENSNSKGIYTETINDTFDSSGNLIVQGSLSVSETGSDTFVSTGKVIVNGTLSSSEENDSINASGQVIIQGSLDNTELGLDIFRAEGPDIIGGILSATEENDDLFVSTGGIIIQGSVNASETNDYFSATGLVLVQGDFSYSEIRTDSFSGSGKIKISGFSNLTEQGIDNFAALGILLIQGNLSSSEENDTINSSGSIIIQGSLSLAEDRDTFDAIGFKTTFGNINVTEYSIDFIDDYIAPNYYQMGYFTSDGWHGSVRNYPMPYPEDEFTTLTVYCYDETGELKPNAQIKIEAVSGNSNFGSVVAGPIYATANNTGIIQVDITKGSGLRFRLDRLDNKSTKGSYFNGTDEDTLILEASVD